MSGCMPCNECTNYGDENACLSPYNLAFSNVTSTTLTLDWVGSPNAISYSVEYKEVTSLTWSILDPIPAPITTTSFGPGSCPVVGLTPGTIYEFRVIAICANRTCRSLTVRIETLLV